MTMVSTILINHYFDHMFTFRQSNTIHMICNYGFLINNFQGVWLVTQRSPWVVVSNCNEHMLQRLNDVISNHNFSTAPSGILNTTTTDHTSHSEETIIGTANNGACDTNVTCIFYHLVYTYIHSHMLSFLCTNISAYDWA